MGADVTPTPRQVHVLRPQVLQLAGAEAGEGQQRELRAACARGGVEDAVDWSSVALALGGTYGLLTVQAVSGLRSSSSRCSAHFTNVLTITSPV